jgi:FKBP-type peptidyl-prolyl cis-trans isomerase 2
VTFEKKTVIETTGKANQPAVFLLDNGSFKSLEQTILKKG